MRASSQMRFLLGLAFAGLLCLGLLAQNPPKNAKNPFEVRPGEPEDTSTPEEKLIRSAGYNPDDANSLLDFFRKRTLTEPQSETIRRVIQRLGDDDFATREKASQEILTFGSAAIKPLRDCLTINPSQLSDVDFEIVDRARRALKAIEVVPHQKLSIAILQSLQNRKSEDTLAVLMNYVPHMDDPMERAACLKTVEQLAITGPQADLKLVDAIQNGTPPQRRLALEALIRAGQAQGRRGVELHQYALLQQVATSDQVPEIRFEVNFWLASLGLDQPSIDRLLDQLPELPRGYLWRAEDFLRQLAQEAAPKVSFGKSPESVRQAQVAWQNWWKQHRDGIDWKHWTYQPRLLGHTLLVAMDTRNSQGLVLELGPDLRELFRIQNLPNPYDAVILPDQSIAIAEMSNNFISFRDRSGQVLKRQQMVGDPRRRIFGSSPQQLQLLEKGELLVVSRNHVALVQTDGQQKILYDRANNYDIIAASRNRDGELAVMIQNPPHLQFVNPEGKIIDGRKTPTNQPPFQGYLTAISSTRLLMTQFDQILEWDIPSGEVVWKQAANAPRCIQRLPNGNTLFVDQGTNNRGRLVEVTPEGQEIWTYALPAQLILQKGYRR